MSNEVKFLDKKPAPEGTITYAIIAHEDEVYDNETVGDVIWEELEEGHEDGEEYMSAVSFMWPPCTELGFAGITRDHLDEDELTLGQLIDEIEQGVLASDLDKLDMVFVYKEESGFTEIAKSEVFNLDKSLRIEFLEAVGEEEDEF